MISQSDVKKLSKKALVEKVGELKKGYYSLNAQRFTTGLEKPHQKKEIKRSLARLLTELGLKTKE